MISLQHTSRLLLALSAPLWLACQSETNALKPGPVAIESEEVLSDGVEVDINPMVDILFVIDDSGSMRAHQANLAKNINQFVDGFAKSSLIDFHIGVLSIWDSRRYGRYDIDENKVIQAGDVPAIGRDGKRLFDPIGELKELKAPVGLEAALKSQPKQYVTRGDNYVDILRETLKIGVREYNKVTTDKVDASGPEYEEVFTPVLAALRNPIADTKNKGFLRKNAHLVVIFVTDANDASVVGADQMNDFFIKLKDRGNFTVFGVINPTSQRLNCARDPSGPPGKIEDLISLTNGRVLNMCADYGPQLAEIGRMVQDRTLHEVRKPVRLTSADKIHVRYGDEDVPASQTNGWTYDARTKTVILRGISDWDHKPGAKIRIRVERVDPTRGSSHCEGCKVSGQ